MEKSVDWQFDSYMQEIFQRKEHNSRFRRVYPDNSRYERD